MDAFYASVEQRDNPEYRGKPIAVGGSKERGVVAAASYEARKYGVKSAMPSVTAARLCPHITFVYPRFEVYKEVSNQIRDIFSRYTDLIEPLSLDEAYLDVTENKIGLPSATLIAKAIKNDIKKELNLIASAGVSFNKFLAKVASDIDKPDGIYVITPEEADDFIDKLEIRKFFGVGKVTAEKMHRCGIIFGKDLKKYSLEQLVSWFGKSGSYFYKIAQGKDERPVSPNRIRKSVGVERTFDKDIVELANLVEVIENLKKLLFNRCEKAQKFGKTITLKIKYGDFTQVTRSKTLLHIIDSEEEIYKIGYDLLMSESIKKPIRLMGLTMSNFESLKESFQLTLKF